MEIYERIFPRSEKRRNIAQEIFVVLKQGSLGRHEMRTTLKGLHEKYSLHEVSIQLVLQTLKKKGIVKYEKARYKYEKARYSISPDYINQINQDWTRMTTQ